MFHGARAQDNPRRILVLPDRPDAEASEVLGILGIAVVTYAWEGEAVTFPGQDEVLNGP